MKKRTSFPFLFGALAAGLMLTAIGSAQAQGYGGYGFQSPYQSPYQQGAYPGGSPGAYSGGYPGGYQGGSPGAYPGGYQGGYPGSALPSGPVYDPPSVHYDRVYHPTRTHWTPLRGLHTHGHYDIVPHYVPGHFDYQHGDHVHPNPAYHD